MEEQTTNQEQKTQFQAPQKKKSGVGKKILGVLLVLILIGGAGFAGYYYAKQQVQKETDAKVAELQNRIEELNKTKDIAEDNTEATTDSMATSSAKVDETASWYLYTPPGKEYSVRLPDGWELHRYMKEAGLYADNAISLTVKADTQAKIIEDQGGRDFTSTAFMLVYHDNNKYKDYSLDTSGVSQSTFKTKEGAVVNKYKYVQTKTPEGFGLPKGSTEYSYVIKNDSSAGILITHDVLKGETDQTALIEKSIRTIKL